METLTLALLAKGGTALLAQSLYRTLYGDLEKGRRERHES